MSKPGGARLWYSPLFLQSQSWSRHSLSDYESGERLSFRSHPPLRIKLGGVILSDQVKSLDWRIRKAEFICKLSRETTDEVLDKLGMLLIDES
jgi:hypothetical protein